MMSRAASLRNTVINHFKFYLIHTSLYIYIYILIIHAFNFRQDLVLLRELIPKVHALRDDLENLGVLNISPFYKLLTAIKYLSIMVHIRSLPSK